MGSARLDRDHVGLAALGLEAGLVVVVKERVQTSAIDVDVLGVDDAKTPGASAGLGGGARGEGWVVVCGVGGEWGGGIGVSLHVGGLGLDEGHVDVAGVVELVIVQLRVLRGGSVHPDRAGGLDQHATAVVDVNLLGVGTELEIVVGNPEPGVLEVEVGGRVGDVHHEEAALASSVGGVGGVGVLGALRELQLGTSGATDAVVNIPHGSSTVLGALEVPLDHDSAGGGAESLEDHVGDLDGTGVTRLADAEDRLGVGLVAEAGALGHDHGPDLTSDLDVLGDVDGVGDDVCAVVKVDDLIGCRSIKDLLDSCGVIGRTITLGTTGLDGNEAGCGEGLVLGLGAGEDGAIGVEQRTG